MHISRFIATLNKIKDATGLYIIVEASNYDWLEYASGNTTYENIFGVPNKITINPTINSHLNDIWHNEWSKLKGHGQTKYWFTMPDPYLASKLMNLSREYLGKGSSTKKSGLTLELSQRGGGQGPIQSKRSTFCHIQVPTRISFILAHIHGGASLFIPHKFYP